MNKYQRTDIIFYCIIGALLITAILSFRSGFIADKKRVIKQKATQSQQIEECKTKTADVEYCYKAFYKYNY